MKIRKWFSDNKLKKPSHKSNSTLSYIVKNDVSDSRYIEIQECQKYYQDHNKISLSSQEQMFQKIENLIETKLTEKFEATEKLLKDVIDKTAFSCDRCGQIYHKYANICKYITLALDTCALVRASSLRI